MVAPFPSKPSRSGTTRRSAVGLILGAPFIAGCAGSPFGGGEQPAGPPQQPSAVGSGQVKVGLLLPLSAAGKVDLRALAQEIRTAIAAAGHAT